MTSRRVHMCTSDTTDNETTKETHDGPYKVLKRNDKHFTVEVKGRQDTVSLDHLKSAHLEPSLTAKETPTTTLTEPTESPQLQLAHHYSPTQCRHQWQPDQVVVCTGQNVIFNRSPCSLEGEYCSRSWTPELLLHNYSSWLLVTSCSYMWYIAISRVHLPLFTVIWLLLFPFVFIRYTQPVE